MLAARLTAALALVLIAAPATAKDCPTPAERRGASTRASCVSRDLAPEPRQEHVRAGKAPGFVDLGNGTEVRISGRVRADSILKR